MDASSHEQQIVDDAVRSALVSGQVGPLFAAETLQAALALAEHTVWRPRFGRSQLDPDVIATLARLYQVRAATANPPDGAHASTDRFAAALLSALLAEVAPEYIPDPIRADVLSIAERMGTDLPLVPSRQIAHAAASARGVSRDPDGLAGLARVSARTDRLPRRVVAALDRLLQSTSEVLRIGDIGPASAQADPVTALMATQLVRNGVDLCHAYETTGRLADLHRGIGMLRTALPFARDPAWVARVQGRLATALTWLGRQTRDQAAFDEAIGLLETATACWDLNAAERATWLYDLADARRERHDRRGDPADLDAAIDARRAAIDTGYFPNWDLWSRTAWRAQLAADLARRLDLRRQSDGEFTAGTLTDDDRAEADDLIALLRRVIDTAGDYPFVGGLLSSLGNALVARARMAYAEKRFDDAEADIAEAIEHHREAVRLMPGRHPRALELVEDLGRALAVQAQINRD